MFSFIDSGFSLVPVIVTLTMLGKFAMTAAFGTVVLYAPEIYPTNLRQDNDGKVTPLSLIQIALNINSPVFRNLGFGLASVWGRIGGMIAPFSSYIVSN